MPQCFEQRRRLSFARHHARWRMPHLVGDVIRGTGGRASAIGRTLLRSVRSL